MKRIGFGGWTCIVLALLIGLAIWWAPQAKEVTLKRQETMSSREVALLCTTDLATQYHIHPVLKIIINGEQKTIPTDLGIQPSCMTSIHTHSGDGIIHVESPVEKDFTLGDFFAVWQKDFSKERILDAIVDTSSEIVVTVNGELVDTYENTILEDKYSIIISYQSK
jgi:hypothetical protein